MPIPGGTAARDEMHIDYDMPQLGQIKDDDGLHLQRHQDGPHHSLPGHTEPTPLRPELHGHDEAYDVRKQRAHDDDDGGLEGT